MTWKQMNGRWRQLSKYKINVWAFIFETGYVYVSQTCTSRKTICPNIQQNVKKVIRFFCSPNLYRFIGNIACYKKAWHINVLQYIDILFKKIFLKCCISCSHMCIILTCTFVNQENTSDKSADRPRGRFAAGQCLYLKCLRQSLRAPGDPSELRFCPRCRSWRRKGDFHYYFYVRFSSKHFLKTI